MTKPVLPFYDITDQDYDLIFISFHAIMDRIMQRRHSLEDLLDLSMLMAWSDFTALKVLRENLGEEGVSARTKFRDNHNAYNKARAYCKRRVEEAQEMPVIFTPEGTPIFNERTTSHLSVVKSEEKPQ